MYIIDLWATLDNSITYKFYDISQFILILMLTLYYGWFVESYKKKQINNNHGKLMVTSPSNSSYILNISCN